MCGRVVCCAVSPRGESAFLRAEDVTQGKVLVLSSAVLYSLKKYIKTCKNPIKIKKKIWKTTRIPLTVVFRLSALCHKIELNAKIRQMFTPPPTTPKKQRLFLAPADKKMRKRLK